MGVILKFPIEDGRLIDIEATQDLDLIFHDYDIQYDMALVEMNLDGTACSNLYTVWQDDPMFVLCGGAGVVAPIVGMGIASCCVGIDAVTRVAVSGIQGDTDYKCLNEASALMQACEKAWRQRKPNPRDVYHRRQELRNRWNMAVRETEKVAYPHNGHLRSSFLLRSFAERKLVDVAEECFEFLYTFIERQVMFG